MVFDALGVLLRGFGGHAHGAEQVHHQPVAGFDPRGQGFAFRGKEYAAIGAGGGEPFARRAMVLMAVAWETPRRRAMSVGRASPELASRSAISSA